MFRFVDFAMVLGSIDLGMINSIATIPGENQSPSKDRIGINYSSGEHQNGHDVKLK